MTCIACIAPPDQLSAELRHGTGEFLDERRAVVSLSLFSAGIMGLIGLYQVGILRRLPEPPLPHMDTDRVNASDEAYSYFSVPDAWLGFISYGVTAALAAAGPKDRWNSAPLLPAALAAKALADTAVAGKLTVDQWTKHKAFCIWCLLSAAATAATVPLVWKEASAACRTLFSSR